MQKVKKKIIFCKKISGKKKLQQYSAKKDSHYVVPKSLCLCNESGKNFIQKKLLPFDIATGFEGTVFAN